jgi:hypothetical protein
MFDKIPIANRGAEPSLAAAIPIIPARTARSNFSATEPCFRKY